MVYVIRMQILMVKLANCSIEFDKDGEYLAIAGVNSKVKIYDYSSVVEHPTVIHMPVEEIQCRVKIRYADDFVFALLLVFTEFCDVFLLQNYSFVIFLCRRVTFE